MKFTYSKILIVASLAFIFLSLSQTIAAKVEIKLNNPKSFKDIEVTNQTHQRSIDYLVKDLTKLFDRLANKHLSNEASLIVEITDVDLAGRVEHMVGPNHDDLRVIRNNDSFKLIFNYKLVNKDGQAIKEGEAKIKNFLSHSINLRNKSKRSMTDHFENELNKWFKELK